MRLWARLAYDGTDFAGWQRQPDVRTVQAELERALEAVSGDRGPVVAAGRTDAGVHATGQVAHFDTGWRRDRDIGELQRALNATLPSDIVVRDLAVAPPGFHARHDAVGRVYRYTIWNAQWQLPLARRTTYHVRAPLDIERIVAAARPLVGERDFAGFGAPMTPGGPTVRRLDRLDIEVDGPRVHVEIAANAFLRHQVRRMVGLLAAVGRGRYPPDVVGQVLDGTPEAPSAPRAPAHGLVLAAVRYPETMEMNDRLTGDGGTGSGDTL